MTTELSEQDILELNTNPVTWAIKQKEGLDQELEDLAIDYSQGTEGARDDYRKSLELAYDYLVSKGVINHGEPAPWLKKAAPV